MPHGYLKRFSREVGRKAARGGGSRSIAKGGRKLHESPKEALKNHGELKDSCCSDDDAQMKWNDCGNAKESLKAKPLTNLRGGGSRSIAKGGRTLHESPKETLKNHGELKDSCCSDDEAQMKWNDCGNATESLKAKPLTNHKIGTCAVCFEDVPLVQLMNKCKHPPACKACLQMYYFQHELRNVTNYPVKCFYPTCDKRIREKQLVALAPSSDDIAQYRRLSVLAKAYESRERTVVHCPNCDHPRQFKRTNRQTQRVLHCTECDYTFYAITDGSKSLDAIILDSDTVRAAELIGLEESGQCDGWVLCPACNLMISGGDFLEVAQCSCGNEFNWVDAKRRVSQISRHARKGLGLPVVVRTY